jgi:hypothetical protein
MAAALRQCLFRRKRHLLLANSFSCRPVRFAWAGYPGFNGANNVQNEMIVTERVSGQLVRRRPATIA